MSSLLRLSLCSSSSAVLQHTAASLRQPAGRPGGTPPTASHAAVPWWLRTTPTAPLAGPPQLCHVIRRASLRRGALWPSHASLAVPAVDQTAGSRTRTGRTRMGRGQQRRFTHLVRAAPICWGRWAHTRVCGWHTSHLPCAGAARAARCLELSDTQTGHPSEQPPLGRQAARRPASLTSRALGRTATSTTRPVRRTPQPVLVCHASSLNLPADATRRIRACNVVYRARHRREPAACAVHDAPAAVGCVWPTLSLTAGVCTCLTFPRLTLWVLCLALCSRALLHLACRHRGHQLAGFPVWGGRRGGGGGGGYAGAAGGSRGQGHVVSPAPQLQLLQGLHPRCVECAFWLCLVLVLCKAITG